MISLSEKDFASYLDIRDERLNGRLLAHRVFRGTVKAVSKLAPGGGTYLGNAFSILITRTGDTGLDQTSYFCNLIDYVPTVGDVVDLIWRTRKEAVVLQVVQQVNAAPLVASGTWTAFTSPVSWADFLGTPPSLAFTLPMISTLAVWWTVDAHIGGVAGTLIEYRVSLDGVSFGQKRSWKEPVTAYNETVAGIDVFTNVAAGAHTLRMQSQNTAGTQTLTADGGLTIYATFGPGS